MMDEIVEWLLEGPPWVEYRTRIDLMRQPDEALQVLAARQAMVSHPQIQGLLTELEEWPGSILKSHKDSGHLLHKLTFIADLGFQMGDPSVDKIITQILEHQSQEGPFQVMVNIKPGYGGTGEDQWAWMLCDAPLVLYALIKFGLSDDPRVSHAIQHLAGLVRENGWPCSVSPTLGKFRGPGRKADPCPYANLAMLKVLALLPDWSDNEVSHIGADTLLHLWDVRKERRPYMFAMGSGFTKLKAPLIWYDLLHVLDILSQFSWLHDDPRMQEMKSILSAKADEQGYFIPESIWMPWKGWSFGQKRGPSPWLTLLAMRVLYRFEK